MKIQWIYIILGCLVFGEGLAYYYEPGPEQPKMFHNQPGVKGTSDEEIENKIRTIMSSGWLPYEIEDVAFTVKDGDVTLTGSIQTLGNKKKFEGQIKRIDGVNQIDNRLEVIKR